MPAPTVEVRRSTPDDWQVHRTLRLHGLQLEPAAFGSSHEREAGRTEDEWRARLERAGSVSLLAHVDGEPAGIAGAYVRTERGETVPELVGMWVEPAHRGAGVGRRLVETVDAWAREQGFAEVRLMVAVGNDAALAFYERLGFAANGYRQPMPSGVGTEQELTRPTRP